MLVHSLEQNKDINRMCYSYRQIFVMTCVNYAHLRFENYPRGVSFGTNIYYFFYLGSI